MTAYYNEIDPFAAQWLRNLIAAGHIAPGDVDERSIEDVRPDDLKKYTQCHFFAGISAWSYSLRRAGWADDRPVWTGSCPCQPYSVAGRQAGVLDERHLWPAWHWLIRECRPPVIFGEQVASKAALEWLELVHADLEGEGYAVGAADICAAGLGAPHIRQRLWFVAYAERMGRRRWRAGDAISEPGKIERPAELRATGGLADTKVIGASANEPRPDSGVGVKLAGAESRRDRSDDGATGGLVQSDGAGSQPGRVTAETTRYRGTFVTAGSAGGLGDAQHARLERHAGHGDGTRGRPQPAGSVAAAGSDGRSDAPDGHWGTADWLYCRDGKWRPVEPGTFALAARNPGRVGQLRAYGNAICAPVAQAFIETAMTCLPE